MDKLYIVRHGETDWNVNKLLQGRTDVGLNYNRKLQTFKLKNILSDYKIEVVIC